MLDYSFWEIFAIFMVINVTWTKEIFGKCEFDIGRKEKKIWYPWKAQQNHSLKQRLEFQHHRGRLLYNTIEMYNNLDMYLPQVGFLVSRVFLTAM